MQLETCRLVAISIGAVIVATSGWLSYYFQITLAIELLMESDVFILELMLLRYPSVLLIDTLLGVLVEVDLSELSLGLSSIS